MNKNIIELVLVAVMFSSSLAIASATDYKSAISNSSHSHAESLSLQNDQRPVLQGFASIKEELERLTSRSSELINELNRLKNDIKNELD